jgi:hypothetical protein
MEFDERGCPIAPKEPVKKHRLTADELEEKMYECVRFLNKRIENQRICLIIITVFFIIVCLCIAINR